MSVTHNLCRVVLADTGRCLFEVNIDCDWLDVVERILLIEGKTEIALVIDAGTLNVPTTFFIFFDVVRTWTNVDLWVAVVHIILLKKSRFFVFELLVDGHIPEADQLFHSRLEVSFHG